MFLLFVNSGLSQSFSGGVSFVEYMLQKFPTWTSQKSVQNLSNMATSVDLPA